MTLVQLFWLIMAIVWFVMELLIAGRSRKQTPRNKTERRSEYSIWLVILVVVFMALYFKQRQLLPLPLQRETRQIIGAMLFASELGSTIRVRLKKS